jgi:hypothetical protein
VHARDLPVVGDVVDSAIVFATTMPRIVRHPFGFVHRISNR